MRAVFTSRFARMLDQLGTTADEVAAFLRKAGIQGVRNTVRRLNPIVRYIELLDGGDVKADVMKRDTIRMRYRDGRAEELPLPGAIVQFLDAFNRGQHTEIELRP